MIECADLVEVIKKHVEERSFYYFFFRNVIPDTTVDFLREIGVFYKI